MPRTVFPICNDCGSIFIKKFGDHWTCGICGRVYASIGRLENVRILTEDGYEVTGDYDLQDLNYMYRNGLYETRVDGGSYIYLFGVWSDRWRRNGVPDNIHHTPISRAVPEPEPADIIDWHQLIVEPQQLNTNELVGNVMRAQFSSGPLLASSAVRMSVEVLGLP